MSAKRVAVATLIALLAVVALPREARAVPLFAQRYHLRCSVCHNVLPELNAFGNNFRDNGYRLPLPKHGTTIVALREQVSYSREPAPGTREWVPAGAILGAGEIGRVEAFVHDSLGSQGGPSSLFLAYVATKNEHSQVLYRFGLYELPLPHSPAQRLDTLITYGYEGNRVGLNDLTLATPRWGVEAERNVGTARIAATFALANAQGSAYGGKPVATGTTEIFNTPEFGVYARFPLFRNLTVGTDLLGGNRWITLSGRGSFGDSYRRGGVWVAANAGRLEFLGEQYYGRDDNADGAGGAINSRGGYARLRWALGPHAFVGIREDAAATPAETRSLLWYAEAEVGTHARLLIEQHRPIPGGPTTLEGALTFGFPWPLGY